MKKALRRITAVIIVIALICALQRLVMPKYMDDILEGSFIGEYYKEKPEHDVIMIGDCEVYENFSPITLWEQYGITSFIRGSAQQLVWQSYYLLEDTLRYETPKVVVFNVLALKYNEPQREEYNRMTIDSMKWSPAKWKDIKASMTEEENALDYVFPILRFHSRITQLVQSDFQYYFDKRKVTHNGYYMRVDVEPVEDLELYAEEEPDTLEIGENAWSYMDKIKDLCKEKGIELVLVKAPSISPIWYDEYEEQMVEYAKVNNLTYINYLELTEELNIDYTKDTYDAGLHMNLPGAEKLSKHLGGLLMSNYELKDHREDKKLAKIWTEKTKFYYDMKAAQYKELEEYGYLKSYGGESEESDEE